MSTTVHRPAPIEVSRPPTSRDVPAAPKKPRPVLLHVTRTPTATRRLNFDIGFDEPDYDDMMDVDSEDEM